MSSLNVSGAETVTIKLKANTKIAIPIEMKFYIDRVVLTKKGNETNELVVLHLTEKHNYESNLQNVNRAYSGKPTTIIDKISKEFLNTNIKVSNEVNTNIKVIIPNLTPLNAMCWIKNKLSAEGGYPYYMFSHIGGSELFLVDLKSMLEASPINAGSPYTYTESAIPSVDPNYNDTSRRRVILDYQVKNTENLFDLINSGLVGANHSYIDVTQNKGYDVKDPMGNATNSLVKGSLLRSNPLYSAQYQLDGKSYNKLESRSISQIMSTQSFDGFDSYNQQPNTGAYKLNSIQRAMDGLIKKQPIDIIVNGIDFLQTEGNSTIGNKLEVRFPANLNDEGKRKDRFDEKKSGDYLIYAAKHSIRTEDYRIALTCLKLSNGEV